MRPNIRYRYILIFLFALSIAGVLFHHGVKPRKFSFPRDSSDTVVLRSNLLQGVDTGSANLSLMIISAFNDPRIPSAVLVLAVGHRSVFSRSIFCLLRSGLHQQVASVIAKEVKEMVPWGIKVSGHYLQCPNRHNNITHISLSASGSNFVKNIVSVITIPKSPPTNVSVASCVSPMFGSAVTQEHLIAWVEMNRMLGVRHFVFYNYSVPSHLEPVIGYYEQRGLATVFQWHPDLLPVGVGEKWPPHQDRLHYAGQVEAYNDCLHRYTNRYKFLMFTDLDELIIPASGQRLDEFLFSADQPPNTHSGFSFRMAYVRGDFPAEKTTKEHWLVRDRHVVFLERSVVDIEPMPSKDREKLILNGYFVRSLAVHDALELWNRWPITYVNHTKAILYHYRTPVDRKKMAGSRSRQLVGYLQPLTRRIEHVLQRLQHENEPLRNTRLSNSTFLNYKYMSTQRTEKSKARNKFSR